MPGTVSTDLEDRAMPQTPHIERHFTGSALVRDTVIGMSDGLTVPFALAAGLSGAVSATGIILTAGLAEIAAGSIAMGLGGYLAARSDAEHYFSERAIEEAEVRDKPEVEAAEVADVFQSYGLTAEESQPIIDALSKRPQAWVEFMMRNELGLEKPDPRRALTSALTIAGAYIAGGFVPLSPYFFAPTVGAALIVSVIGTLIALTVFGYIKPLYRRAAGAQRAPDGADWRPGCRRGLHDRTRYFIKQFHFLGTGRGERRASKDPRNAAKPSILRRKNRPRRG
jgi:VIT1/CCC1 family predicted Fe2+/Mn2+ transporter